MTKTERQQDKKKERSNGEKFRKEGKPRIRILKTDVSGCSVIYILLPLDSMAGFGNPRTADRLRLSDARHQVKRFAFETKSREKKNNDG
jgi:hypothetical protein